MKELIMADYAEGLLPKAREQLGKPVVKAFFKAQSDNEKQNDAEGLGSAADFIDVFKDTVHRFAKSLKREDLFPKDESSRQYYTLQGRAEDFMDGMRAIGMEDTIYPDVRSSMPQLLENVDGIAVWSSGHPNYQDGKVVDSKVKELMEGSALRPSIISRNKEKRTAEVLSEFAAEHPDSDITVAIYDDAQGNFGNVEKVIKRFEDETGRRVTPLYVWAVLGRSSWDFPDAESEKEEVERVQDKLEGHLESVRSFDGFVQAIKEQRGKSNSPLLVLLDFDGALSDNRLMRMRQYEAFITHAKKAVIDMGIAKDAEEAEGVVHQLNQILAEGESKK